MEMKPEYNYGTFGYYTLGLHSSNVGDNPDAVIAVLGDYYEGYAADEHQILQERTKKNGDIISFADAFPPTHKHLFIMRNRLEAAGAMCTLKDEHFYTVLPPTIHPSSDKPEYLNYVEHGYMYQRRLNYGAEYALDKWALDSGITEAYRIAIYRAARAIVIRIWWHDNKIWMYDAIDRNQKRIIDRLTEKFGTTSSPAKPAMSIEADEIENFRSWMHDNFWKEKFWYQDKFIPIRGFPASYFVEGWYYGKYKLEFAPAQYRANLPLQMHTIIQHLLEKYFGYRR